MDWKSFAEHTPVFRFALEGEPIPKGRPRFMGGSVITPERTVSAEDALRLAFKQRHPGAVPIPEPEAVVAVMDFYTAKPRKRSNGRGDVDNLAKLVLDALNTLAWDDDYQIEIVIMTLNHESEAPGTEVAIYRRY